MSYASVGGGVDGQDGLDAYEVAVEEGFEGTREEWLASLEADLEFTPENVANKQTVLSPSATEYPNADAVIAAIAAAVVGLLDYRDEYDASTNLFPSTGGSGTAGAILKADTYIISVAGTLGGVAVKVFDLLVAKTDSPAQTAANWSIYQTELGYSPENVANKDTDGALTANSDTKYPSQKAVKTYSDTKQISSEKDASGGYVGKTLEKINFKNADGTFISFLANTNTAARTYTYQDRDGTIADNTDLALKKNKIFTKTTVADTTYTMLGTEEWVCFTSNSAVTLTWNTTEAAAGYNGVLEQVGTGQVTWSGGTAIKVNARSHTKTYGQNAIVFFGCSTAGTVNFSGETA